MYRERIQDVINTMFELVPCLLPSNRVWAETSLNNVHKLVAEMTVSIQLPKDAPKIADKFTPYVEYEEQRIKRTLEQVKYRIDALDTVYAIAGNDRLERVRPSQFCFYPPFTYETSQSYPWSSFR